MAGYYCDSSVSVTGTDITKRCDPGRCGYAQETTSSCTKDCPPGYYCPTGRANACPDAPSQSGISYALACSSDTVLCPTPTQCYCPGRNTAPVAVPSGTYASQLADNVTGQTFTSFTSCPLGTLCSLGIRYGCGNGTYQDQMGQTSCKTCLAGRFCPGPSDPLSGTGSTSGSQLNCVSNTSDPAAAQWYCPAGTARPLLVGAGNMTIPTNVALYNREGQQACPLGSVCTLGVAYPRLSWNQAMCPGNTGAVTVPELWSSAQTNWTFNAVLGLGLYTPNFTVSYALLSQAFYNPTNDPAMANCVSTVNDGIWDLSPTNGTLLVKRYSPDNVNANTSLQYEACPLNTNVRYLLSLQATATELANRSVSVITCALVVSVADRNDQPRFAQTSYSRVIPEKSIDNIPAGRCSNVLATTGCPDDASPLGDPAVAAFDDDYFNKGNLYYAIQTSDDVNQTLKLNACTGQLSQKGGTVLSFASPLVPTYNSTFKRLTFNISVTDDGNGGLFPNKSHNTVVFVYVQNINDAPTFTQTSAQADLWIPERYAAGTFTRNFTVQFADEDPYDSHVLTLSRNDAGAFQIVNNTIMTTPTGAGVIDYESAKRSYSIDIQVADNGVPPKSVIQTFNIRVANTNDPPQFDASSLVFYLVENPSPGQPACRDLSGLCSTGNSMDYVRSSDPDVVYDSILTDGTTYSLALNPGNRFFINPTTGQITVNGAVTIDFEDTNTLGNLNVGTGRYFTITVNATSNGTGVVTQPGLASTVEWTASNATVFIVNVNEAPYFVTSNASRIRVLETWPVGVALSAYFNASDPDNVDPVLLGSPAPMQSLFYSVSPTSPGTGAGMFAVDNDPATGFGRIKVTSALSYNSAPSCGTNIRCVTLNVRVSDSGTPQLWAERLFTFEIVHVNHAPTWNTLPALSVGEMADWNQTIVIPVTLNASVRARQTARGGKLTPCAGRGRQHQPHVLGDGRVGLQVL
jgi:hypothetical protein